MKAYDPQNIFAKILRGEIPCFKVYEDERALSFLDIMPMATGHTLILPKAPARNILDIAPSDLAHVITIAKRVALAARDVFEADGITLNQFSEPAGGQSVFHLHIHIIPRKDGVPLRAPMSYKEDPEILADQASKLAAALQAQR
jgi:histidine triad (HIT) family protein